MLHGHIGHTIYFNNINYVFYIVMQTVYSYVICDTDEFIYLLVYCSINLLVDWLIKKKWLAGIIADGLLLSGIFSTVETSVLFGVC